TCTRVSQGALAMAVPGELAGLHAAWSRYGRLPWKELFVPAIRLAREGYAVVPSVPSLRAVFAPKGRVLAAGETYRNPVLADVLEAVANEGVEAFYNGHFGEQLVRDARAAGGTLTMDDLREYKIEVTATMSVDAMGYTILGMPPPSTGTMGMALILNILKGSKSLEFLKGFLGVHRLIEALKHMLAIRMDLGDPDYINVSGAVLLSKIMVISFSKVMAVSLIQRFRSDLRNPLLMMEPTERPWYQSLMCGGCGPECSGNDDDRELHFWSAHALADHGMINSWGSSVAVGGRTSLPRSQQHKSAAIVEAVPLFNRAAATNN
ncbi:hypothetical protein EJB05_47053, partial [Eragrostis curvula]